MHLESTEDFGVTFSALGYHVVHLKAQGTGQRSTEVWVYSPGPPSH